jgi:hypothetical protein
MYVFSLVMNCRQELKLELELHLIPTPTAGCMVLCLLLHRRVEHGILDETLTLTFIQECGVTLVSLFCRKRTLQCIPLAFSFVDKSTTPILEQKLHRVNVVFTNKEDHDSSLQSGQRWVPSLKIMMIFLPTHYVEDMRGESSSLTG